MFSLLTFLIGVIFNLLKSKKELLIQISLQKKEIEILLRKNQKKRLNFLHADRVIFSILNRIGHIKESISIVNAIAERFVGSIRREALDYFLLFTEKQIKNILAEYVD